jgi:hypothetical protein
MMYTAYVRANKRKVICEEEIPLERALDFLEETRNGLVIDSSGNEYVKEELKDHAESIRSKSGDRKNSEFTGIGKVHEDPDPELPEFAKYYTESSSERDS